MSKLDIIILDCVNKAIDQKEEKLGDYVDPTKADIKALFLELIGDIDENGKDAERALAKLVEKVEAL